jgi:hypothetical protein
MSMKLRDLPKHEYAHLADQIAELCEQVGYDSHPELPVGAVEPGPEDWPEGALAVELWSCLNRAALLAILASSGVNPRTNLKSLGHLFMTELEAKERRGQLRAVDGGSDAVA